MNNQSLTDLPGELFFADELNDYLSLGWSFKVGRFLDAEKDMQEDQIS